MKWKTSGIQCFLHCPLCTPSLELTGRGLYERHHRQVVRSPGKHGAASREARSRASYPYQSEGLAACGEKFFRVHFRDMRTVRQDNNSVDYFCRRSVQGTMEKSKIAPQQYKQPSRKGKKAWRKNVDISEVQVGLEQLREEVIQGCVSLLYDLCASC